MASSPNNFFLNEEKEKEENGVVDVVDVVVVVDVTELLLPVSEGVEEDNHLREAMLVSSFRKRCIVVVLVAVAGTNVQNILFRSTGKIISFVFQRVVGSASCNDEAAERRCNDDDDDVVRNAFLDCARMLLLMAAFIMNYIDRSYPGMAPRYTRDEKGEKF